VLKSELLKYTFGAFGNSFYDPIDTVAILYGDNVYKTSGIS